MSIGFSCGFVGVRMSVLLASAVRAPVASHACDISVDFCHRRDHRSSASPQPPNDPAAIVAKAGAFHFVFGFGAARMDFLGVSAGREEQCKKQKCCGDKRKFSGCDKHAVPQFVMHVMIVN
jgi:hypothetical protein